MCARADWLVGGVYSTSSATRISGDGLPKVHLSDLDFRNEQLYIMNSKRQCRSDQYTEYLALHVTPTRATNLLQLAPMAVHFEMRTKARHLNATK